MNIINTVQTICPQCHEVIEGHYTENNGKVFLCKTCPHHGEFSTLISPSMDEYIKWTSTPTINIPPKVSRVVGADEKKEGSQCPLHCGLCNNHLQTPCCILIEITQRCNQHCPYCFASSSVDKSDPVEASLTLDTINKKLDYLLELGEARPFNIQFSGGEPTIRDDLPEILKMAKSKGFPYLQINTNGKRLAEEPNYAEKLKNAGASVIFLQFDGTNDRVYQKLRNEDLWETKKKAIEACRKAQLPITLVPTLIKNVNLNQISSMLEFLWNNVDIVSGIHFQPVSFFGRFPKDAEAPSQENKVTLFELLNEIEVSSKGQVKACDLVPMNTGHTLCGFHGTFLLEKDRTVFPLHIPHALNESQNADQSEACCCTGDPLEVIRKDRGFVLNKWGAKGKGSPTKKSEIRDGPPDFDEFLEYMRNNMFTISAMAFQDLMSLDGDRLKRCRVHVLSQDNRIIPFCSYNTLYREDDLKK